MAIPFFSKLRDKKTHLKLINRELQKVRDEIAAQTEVFEPYTREYMRTICRGQGKMLRPGLVLLTAAATGGIKPEHITFAALLEMIHMASLIHDDVLDKADVRRDQPTPNALWGNELAVLLGDSLLAQAIVMGAEIGGSKFCRRMAVAMRDLCQGEVEQSSRLWDADMSRADYYELIRKKTATLFAVAMSGTAYLQGMDDEMTEQLNRMGTLLGISYQIYDDCLDLTGSDESAGKTLGTDNEKGKLTLPVFFLMESSSEDVAEQVRDMAVKIYKVVGAQGLSRVDFFVTYEDNRVVFNEINTLPGFTSISMYPKLFAASGIPYGQLIDNLLELALEACQ